MVKGALYIYFISMLMLYTNRVSGQITMSDRVCIGTTREYHVVANTGSTYTWWIDGEEQAEKSNKLTHTWHKEGVFILKVQETSADGCKGPIREGEVFVDPLNLNYSPPSIRCMEPIRVNTDANSCDARITEKLNINYSDSNNIVALTWKMTGATEVSSSLTGINKISTYAFNTGVTVLTFTITDTMGMSAQCNTEVTVTDSVKPTFRCVTEVRKATAQGESSYKVEDSELDPFGVWDNCSIDRITNSYNNSSTLAGAEFPKGETIVRWTVTDKSGNEFACSFTVTVHVQAEQLLIPNVFTPNGDGVNDVWEIGGLNYYPEVTVKVFDRWGRMIFSSAPGYPKPWKGERNGTLLSMDAYYYIIDLKNGSAPIRGSVTLIP
jgi:gliding motility-associated-like protein